MNIDKEIDKIFEPFGDYGYHDSSYGDCYTCKKVTKAKQNFKRLVLQAQIDELVWATGGIKEYTDDGKTVVPDRIAQLTKELEELDSSGD